MLHPQNPPNRETLDVSVQIWSKPASQFDLISRDTEESKFLDSVDFRDAKFQVETVIHTSFKTL